MSADDRDLIGQGFPRSRWRDNADDVEELSKEDARFVRQLFLTAIISMSLAFYGGYKYHEMKSEAAPKPQVTEVQKAQPQ